MHFRHFLISGLMVGAAMFFPDNAFAEKNEYNPQEGQAASPVEMEKEPVKIDFPAKAEQANSQEKTVVLPEPAQKNQAEAKQLPAQNTPNQAASNNLPEQAKGNVQSELNKTEKAAKAIDHKKAAVVQENNKEENSTPPISLRETSSDVKVDEAKPAKLDRTVNSQGEGSIKQNQSVSVVQEPKNVPASKEEIPKVSQMLNQTQRSNSSGGQSNDRVNHGLNNLSLWDKWFEWDTCFEIKLVQPYLSRLALMNTQWVNAPPAPPPQNAPLL